MSNVYYEPDHSVTKMMDSLLREYYRPLVNLEPALDVRIRMVTNEDDHPLKKGGWPCLALCHKVPLRWRAAGAPDVWIEVDAFRFMRLTEQRQRAVIHHELHHIDVVGIQESVDDRNTWICKVDSLGRPVVKLRPHDWEIGGFTTISELYGQDAIEVILIESAVHLCDQGVFNFMRADSAAPQTLSMAGSA